MSLTIDTITQELTAFISGNIVAPGVTLTPDTVLGNLGVDSFSVIEIVLFIERKFGIVIPDDQLTPENISSVASLARCTYNLSSGISGN